MTTFLWKFSQSAIGKMKLKNSINFVLSCARYSGRRNQQLPILSIYWISNSQHIFKHFCPKCRVERHSLRDCSKNQKFRQQKILPQTQLILMILRMTRTIFQSDKQLVFQQIKRQKHTLSVLSIGLTISREILLSHQVH